VAPDPDLKPFACAAATSSAAPTTVRVGHRGTASASCLNKRLRQSLDGVLRECRDALYAHAPAPGPGGDRASVDQGLVREAVRRFLRAFLVSPSARIIIPAPLLSATHAGGSGSGSGSGEDSARCVDKMSREHIAATAALLQQLERTGLFRAVTEVMDELSRQTAATDPILAGAAAGGADTAVVFSSATSPHDSAALREALAETADSAPGPCGACGVSCVRVRRAHVLSMLLLAWSAPPRALLRSLEQEAAGAATGATAGHALPPLVAALARECGRSLSDPRDEVLRTEATMMHQQIHDASVCLFGDFERQ
jgi:hypothetical protein